MTAGMWKCLRGHFSSSKRNEKRSMSITCEQKREDRHMMMDYSLLPTCFHRKRMPGEGSSSVSMDMTLMPGWTVGLAFGFVVAVVVFYTAMWLKEKKILKTSGTKLKTFKTLNSSRMTIQSMEDTIPLACVDFNGQFIVHHRGILGDFFLIHVPWKKFSEDIKFL